MSAYPIGTRVRKTKGSSWQGVVVGHYSTSLTPVGVCVESEREPGSVQIYPVSAVEEVPEPVFDVELERLRLKVLHAQEERDREYRHPETDWLHQYDVDHALASAQDALAKYESGKPT